MGAISCMAILGSRPTKTAKADVDNEEALNAVKAKVAETFDQEILGATTHQDYNNENHRRQTKSPASGHNIFVFNNEYENTEIETSPKAGAGAYRRIATNANKGLVIRANSDRTWLDGYDGTDFTLNFFVKDYSGSHYYEGLYSFRHGTPGWNIDVGPAGFWCNPISTSDVSDDTYRKFSNASTSSWTGRTMYNNFDNGTFRTSGGNADNMEAGRWYMITQTFSATDGVTFYRDGVKKMNYTPSTALAGNNGDPEPWTMDILRTKLLEVLKTKNTRIMFFRGRSSQRTIGVCTDELTIFRGALTEEEINIWMNSYTTVSYKDGDSTLKTYTDVARNLIPTYTPTKDNYTFYKWATDQKLLTQMSQEMQLADHSVYADWKDGNNVSDGAKILAQDIVDLDTCTQYDEAEDWNDKIDMLDSDDTDYVENFEFNDGKDDYTVRQKLDYMSQYAAAQKNMGSPYLKVTDTSNDFGIIIVVTSLVLVVSVSCLTLFLRRRQKDKR